MSFFLVFYANKKRYFLVIFRNSNIPNIGMIPKVIIFLKTAFECIQFGCLECTQFRGAEPINESTIESLTFEKYLALLENV